MTNSNTSMSTLLRSSASLLTLMGVMFSIPATALEQTALPQGGSVSSGAATINYSTTAPKLDIDQTSTRAVIDWNSFNIGEKATTEFHQPDAASVTVNRVNQGSPSQILGAMKANGNVMVLNQNGVVFGGNAQVDVGGLVASTGTLNEQKFMQNGTVELSNLQTDGKIQNDGTITVADKGLAAFVAPEVANNGIIAAKTGKIALAAGGERATVDLYGDKLVELALDEKATKAIATNTGTLEGNTVAMTASAVEGVVNNIVNAGGIIEATSLDASGGRIILSGNNADMAATGAVSARGTGAQNGGSIAVKSNKNIWVSKTAKLDASAGTVGHGGTVDVVADKQLKVAGTIKARGGSQQGDGGTVETSGHGRLDVDGTVDSGAMNGKAGSWTIDPRDLIIQDTDTTDVSGDGSNENPYASNDEFLNFSPSFLDAQTVRTALDGNTSLYITTVGGSILPLDIPGFPFPGFPFPLFQNGDIVINADLNVTGDSNASLNLNAAGSIYFGDLNANGISSTAGLNLAFITGGDIFINRDMKVQGTVDLNAGGNVYVNGTILTGGSNATIEASQVLIGDTFTLPETGGPIVFLAQAKAKTLSQAKVLIVTPSGTPGLIDAQGGDIVINNTDRFFSANADTLLTTGTGAITLNQYDNGTLQNAIDAIANSGTGQNTLNARAGTYTEQVRLTQSNFLLQGDSQYNTIIEAPLTLSNNFTEGGLATQGLVSAVNQSNIAIDGVTIDDRNQGSTGRYAGIAFLNTSGSINNSTVKNLASATVNIPHQGTGIYVVNTDGNSRAISVTNTQVSRFERNGIFFKGAGLANTANGNTVKGIGTAYADQTGIRALNTGDSFIASNTVTDVAFGIHAQNIASGSISLNDLTGRTYGIYLRNSDNILVSGNTANGGSSAGIALENSKNASVMLNRTFGADTGILLFANSTNAVVDTNLIDGQNVGHAGIYSGLGDQNVAILNNFVANVTQSAIDVRGGAQIIDSNFVANAGTGIQAFVSPDVIISNNILQQIVNKGIEVRTSTGATVVANTIADSTGLGIIMTTAGNGTISANSVSVTGDGITVSGMGDATVSNNTVSAAAYGVVVIDSGSATLSGNQISGTTTAGLYTGGTTGTVTLDSNTVTSPADGAQFAAGNIVFSGTNTFDSANDGLVFDPLANGNAGAGTLTVSGATFGTTAFLDQAGYYIRLANGALFGPGLPGSPIVYDASQVSFDGFVAGTNTLSASDSATIEARLFDFDDDNTLGQIFAATPAVIVPPVVTPTGPGTPVTAALTVDPTTIIPDEALNRSQLSRIGSVTITGLPFAPGAIPASVLAGLDSAAGGDATGNGGGLSASQLNALDSAAGGESASCWGDVYSHFGRSTASTVTFSLDTAPQALFDAQVKCGASNI